MSSNNQTNSEKYSTRQVIPSQEIRVRFAPSPTGVFHVGGARTALFNYLYAKKYNGKFILRIEDTDRERSKKEHEKDILNGLSWLKIPYDEMYRQSDRGKIYKNYLEKLLNSGSAYLSKENSKEEATRDEVIRFRNTNEKIIFNDVVRGDISFDTNELGDFVIAKDILNPLYNFASVVDDFDMMVTHVIRGEDGISNTPRQILIQNALGAPRPIYAHIPFILSDDRAKLSKRHGAVSLNEFERMGVLPAAMINFLALIGWNPGGDKELFTIDELIEKFTLDKVQKSGAIFNLEKLSWMNGEYVNKLSDKEFIENAIRYLPTYMQKLPNYNAETFRKILLKIRERINLFEDIKKMYEQGDFSYYFELPEYDKNKLAWKSKNKISNNNLGIALKHIKYVVEIITKMKNNNFSAVTIKEKLWDYASKEGRGEVLWPMRYALSGRDKSLDPFTIAEILGKEETLERLNRVLEMK